MNCIKLLGSYEGGRLKNTRTGLDWTVQLEMIEMLQLRLLELIPK